MLRKGVKIYKFINQRSALDVTGNLEYYKEKQDKDELEYNGKLIISITANNQYLKAYISKSKAKSLFQSFIDGNFSKIYPEGFVDYGGSTRDGQVIARTLSLEMLVSDQKDRQGKQVFDKDGKPKKKVQIRFTISESPGQRTQTGGYKSIGKSTAFVQSYLDPLSIRECAIEVTDFIHSAEIAAQVVGKPLHTFMSVSNERENEIGLQSFLSVGGKTLMNSLNEIPTLSNNEFKTLRLAVEEEYQRRAAAYKKPN